ncbi:MULTISPECIES: CoA transferase [unclassified Arthrobacter]|uniref:CoA transferase n=1 Tax=unclassified Arthrobacter TaxID=235627 RepID=UPI001D13FA0D|nr:MULTISPECIES: CoA transferase [unclassified Arthrobacter]MCC3274960.1 CoA transferase [Arthrobacter sp. zg-Y20]MCC9177443.1 CoA transferase [Arthrobacter sp. zg-Y750]MDK1315117.1 CoA transferase [Arthrobacter sp. zg.Y20]WIB04962.1 CoA transferase [Arthrobacter sp. zg-Y20]
MAASVEIPVPPLVQSLSPLLAENVGTAPWTGPRWWWAGPLDVEGLALGSVQMLATAVASYAESTGRRTGIGFTSDCVAAAFASFAHLRINDKPIQGFAPLSGFRRTADGWVRLHANYPHHEAALRAALDVQRPEQVDDAVRSRTAAEVEEAVTARGGLATAVRTPEQWGASAAGQAVAAEPWLRLELRDARPGSAPKPAGDGLLSGLRVLDLTRVIAGPSGSRILGALGADVLRVDPPALPELADQYVDTGFAKRSVVADLADPDVQPRLRALLAEADVVLTAYRGGSLARLGLDPVSLRTDYPHLALVSLDAWGDRGPWTERRGFDSIVQAATGIAHLYGSTGNDGAWRPGALPVQALDYATGLGMSAAAVALVAARSRGIAGAAHLSLARTAQELRRLPGPPPGTKASALPEPALRRGASSYGELTYVPPPLLIGGVQLEYPWVPPPYGSADLAWDQPLR